MGFADLPGFVAGDFLQGGADVRCGDFPAFTDGMARGWVRARAGMLGDVQRRRVTADAYRAMVAQFRGRWGDEINRRVNDYAVAALARGER